MRLKSILLSLSTLVALNAGVAHASLIVNGGFEQTTNGTNKELAAGTSTTATNYTTLTGWNSVSLNNFLNGSYKTSTSTDGGYNFVMNPASSSSSLAVSLYNSVKASPSGGNFVASDPVYGPGVLYQTVNGLVVGDLYSLTFSYALGQQSGFSGSNTDYWTVGFGTDTSFTTQNTSALSITQGGFSGWQTATMTFTATAATEMLGFLAQASAAGQPPFMLLDNVSFDAVKTATGSVPEPTTLSLLLGGLGVAGLAARRRRAKRG